MLVLKETIDWREKGVKIRIFYSEVLDDHIAIFPDKIADHIKEWAEWFYDIPVYLESEIELYRRLKPTAMVKYALHQKRKKEMLAR